MAAVIASRVYLGGQLMSQLSESEASIVDRLLQIIADEGLVDRARLEPGARLDDIGISHDDLTLIGNAVERQFDRDMLGDDALDQCETVRELLELIGRRIAGDESEVTTFPTQEPQ